MRVLLIDSLRDQHFGNFSGLVNKVIEKAEKQDNYRTNESIYFGSKGHYDDQIPQHELFDFVEPLRQLMWEFLVQGLLVFGSHADNPREQTQSQWPYYRLTPRGESFVQDAQIQPYDPDGFLAEFARRIPNASPVVPSYVQEAVTTFNARCYRASAVMIGCAAEKAVFDLWTAFHQAIPEGKQKKKFGDSNKIFSGRLKNLSLRLREMAESDKLLYPHKDYVGAVLHATDFIRTERNDAGHPQIINQFDHDSAFMTLRMVTNCFCHLSELTEFFGQHSAQWWSESD